MLRGHDSTRGCAAGSVFGIDWGQTMCRIIITAAALVAGTTVASAQYSGYGYGTGSNPDGHSVSGHFNSNGSFTQPHHSSNPNSTQIDNYSTRGNVNPYTATTGTRSPHR